MAFTDIGRITDSSDRALAAIERARAVVGDGPVDNANLDRLADTVENARDAALLDCIPGSAPITALDQCERGVARVEAISRVAIEAAETMYARAVAGDEPDDGGEDGSPLPRPTSPPSSLSGPVMLAVSTVVGFLLGVLR